MKIDNVDDLLVDILGVPDNAIAEEQWWLDTTKLFADAIAAARISERRADDVVSFPPNCRTHPKRHGAEAAAACHLQLQYGTRQRRFLLRFQLLLLLLRLMQPLLLKLLHVLLQLKRLPPQFPATGNIACS